MIYSTSCGPHIIEYNSFRVITAVKTVVGIVIPFKINSAYNTVPVPSRVVSKQDKSQCEQMIFCPGQDKKASEMSRTARTPVYFFFCMVHYYMLVCKQIYIKKWFQLHPEGRPYRRVTIFDRLVQYVSYFRGRSENILSELASPGRPERRGNAIRHCSSRPSCRRRVIRQRLQDAGHHI